MKHHNHITILWECLEKTEKRHTKNWTPIWNFVLVTKSTFKGEDWLYREKISKVYVNIWWDMIDYLVDNMRIWDIVFVKGKIESREYTSKDWMTLYNTSITWEDVTLCKKDTLPEQVYETYIPSNSSKNFIDSLDNPF